MELKRKPADPATASGVSFNRTTMELKQDLVRINRRDLGLPFNRTTMELKRVYVR